MAQDTQIVQDAQIIEDTDSDAQLVANLGEMIKNHRNIIENTRKELTEQRGMLNDVLANDPTYAEHQEEVKKTTKTRNATKAEILKRPEVTQLAEKVKGLSSELREYSRALSDYLREYQRVSGQNTIEDNGEVLEIFYVAKLRKINQGRK